MISAVLSNSAISSVRGSGLAADPRGFANSDADARGNASSEQAEGSPANRSQSSGNVQPLTLQAVLALQEGAETATTADATADNEDAVTRGNDRGTEDRDAEGSAPGADQGEAGAPGSRSAASTASSDQGTSATDEGDSDGDGLNEAEEKQVRELQQRDREVRAHEQAHARVGGAYAGAPSYSFQQGPDGKRYAIGGEVSIDTSGERTPEATIRKMQIVIRAATAPAEPSSQDLKVAQQARAQLAEAQAQLRAESAEALRGDDAKATDGSASGRSDTGPAGADTEAGGAADRPNGDRRSDTVVASRAYAAGGFSVTGRDESTARSSALFA
ncbi:putative metalloprotease CJM1_0395 family protein [Roseibium sp.]|uniref:putative metalloprotease CJM1_0395 family protein n=1 Tax=Roseibium sp. TaxID=1936156 RepID=UPI003A97EE82